MNPNDRRRRLQVLNSANPSVRVAAAPKVSVTPAAKPTQRLAVSSPYQAPQPTQDTRSWGTKVFDQVNPLDDNRTFKNPGSQRDPNFVQRNASPTGLFNIGKEIVQGAARAPIEFGMLIPSAYQRTKAAEDAKKAGQDPNAAAANAKSVSWQPSGWQKRLFGEDKIQPINKTAEDLSAVSEEKLGVKPNSTAITAGLIGASFIPGFRSLFKRGEKALTKSVAKADTAEKVAEILNKKGIQVDDNVAQYLAEETNKIAVDATIKELNHVPADSLKVYTASSPDPRSLPEGTSPPSEKGTPNDRFPSLNSPSFAPITPETQTLMADLEKRAMTAPRPYGTTRVFQATENGVPTDWVFSDASKLANFINGRTNGTMKLDYYDIPDSQLVKQGEDVFQVKGGVQASNKVADAAEGLRHPDVNARAKELVKSPKYANDVAAAANGSSDALTTAVRMVANNENKGQIRDMLFGNNGILNDLGLNNAAKNKLVRDLTKTTDPQEVSDTIVRAVNTADTTAEDVATKAATTAPEAQAAQIADSMPAGGVADNAVEPTAAPAVADNVAQEINQNADEAAKELSADNFPDLSPEARAEVQKVIDSLPGAQKNYDDVAKARSKEKAQRIAAGNAAYEAAGGGEKGIRAKLSALGGRYQESGFNPVEVDETVKKEILDTIQSSGMRDFEKLNTQNAIRKIWGDNNAKPTASDINYIRKYFGDDLADSVEAAVEMSPKTWRDVVSNIAGIPRAAMSTLDFSMGGRQGAPVLVRNSKEWGNANKESLKYATSSKYFDDEMSKIQNDDAYEAITSKMGIRFPAISKEFAEEFVSTDYIEKVPVYGKYGVAGARRAYDGGLSKLRYNIAKQWIDSAGGLDNFIERYSDKELKDLGEVINTFTGSGGKKGGLLDQHMKTLSNTLFAPRFWAANLNRLNPVWYARLSPVARKEAMKYQSSFYAMAGTILGLAAAMPGVDVGWDPRSADFAKIKVGNTRYDILGGQQQNLRLIAQLATGKKVDSTTGEVQELGEGFVPSRAGIALDTLKGKANPLLGFAWRAAEVGPDGTDKYGEVFNPFIEASKLLIPLNFQSVAETASDRGSLAMGVLMNIPGFVGISAQTYGDVKTKDKGVDSTGKVAFKGKITPDMVLDGDGKPVLDEKGRPVKVKFKGDETDLQKTAMIDDKRKSALADQYRRTLPEEDQALMKLTDDQLTSYVKSGKINQDRYEEIKQYQKNAETIDGIDVPEGATSDFSQNFYKKYNSLTKNGQEKYLKGADDNAKQITKLLNENRPKGLSEFKPSNAIAKAYAEFEKDIQTHPEYTDVDLQNKRKEFQKFVYKLNYSEKQQDLYNEGGSDDLKTLISNGQVSQADLNEAIKIDNELYAAGITSSLKFSKKFRNEYGYSVPAGSGGSGSGSTASKRTGINSLVPKTTTARTGGSVPKFSSTTRSRGFNPGVDLPSKSSKKVSIKL